MWKGVRSNRIHFNIGTMIEFLQIPLLKDNYSVIVRDASASWTLVVDPADADPLQAALDERGWPLTHILNTHWHGDHVGGVVDSPLAAQLAPKTLLTLDQLRTLQTAPQVPQVRLTDAASRRYILVDYQRYLPVAPGIVLIKSPGHTPEIGRAHV